MGSFRQLGVFQLYKFCHVTAHGQKPIKSLSTKMAALFVESYLTGLV